jgi:hypothetical protein
MSNLEQNVRLSDFGSSLPPMPKWSLGSPIGPSEGFSDRDRSTGVGRRTMHEMIDRVILAGDSTNFGARTGPCFELQEPTHHLVPISRPGGGPQFGTLESAEFQVGSSIWVSPEAERFARRHGLWGSLILLKSLIMSNRTLFLGVAVNLVPDAEITGRFTVSFTVRTDAEISDILDFDERIRGLVYDQLPMDDQVYFAVQFEFA